MSHLEYLMALKIVTLLIIKSDIIKQD